MNEENLVRHYDQLFRFQDIDYRSRNVRKLIKRFLQGGSVLDIGCGTGHLLRELAEDGRDVTGVEPSKELFEYSLKVCEKNKKIKLFNLGGENLNTLNKKFDNIVSVDVIEHVEDDVNQIKNFYSVSGQNAFVVVLVPAFQFLYGERDKKIGHLRRYSKKELIEKMESNGFKVIKSRYWNALGFLVYFLFEKILRKKIPEEHRYNEKKGINLLINKILDLWFRVIENNFSFGFGLSLLVVGKKVNKKE